MNKDKIFRNVLYIFFAFCFLGTGCFSIGKSLTTPVTEAVAAEDFSIDNQSLPDYFSVTEYVATTDSTQTSENSSSLIDTNVFMVSTTSTNSNLLALSFVTNGTGTETLTQYNYVYYPTSSTSTFNFYYFLTSSVSVTINGQAQTYGDDKSFITDSEVGFENLDDSITLQTFEMVFDTSGTNTYDKNGDIDSTSGAKSNSISVLDDDNNVIEGLYTVTINYTLFTCTDGNQSGTEASFTSETKAITYSFFVISQDSYFENSLPKVTNSMFDSTVKLSSSSASSAYYLYSNYTSTGSANKAPYIEYDMTRYELSISKELNSVTSSATIEYDAENETISCSSDIVSCVTTGTTVRVYFYNLGIYTLEFTAIKVFSITTQQNGEESTTTQYKTYLDGVTASTKNIMVHMYGYQVGYTDYDSDVDSNNNHATTEMRTISEDGSTFENSADVTSAYVNSSTGDYQPSTIVSFLNSTDEDGDLLYSPVTTNQTPIKFTSNATLVTSTSSTSSSASYILTTNSNLSGFSETQYALDGNTLYRKNFSGNVESTPGVYIYVLTYTYENYYNSNGALSTSTQFVQIFYFEIVKESPTISVTTATDSANEIVYSDDFVNTPVLVQDTTKSDSPYSKDVTVQIYAQNYSSGAYLDTFGGTNGISLSSMISSGSVSGYYSVTDTWTVQLEANALYTIRLYYSSDLSGSSSTSISTTPVSPISEMSFTIDAEEISGLTARNVTSGETSSTYQILDTLTSFSTNQGIVLSWNTKASGAQTTAYYRYFPLSAATYYSTDSDSTSSIISALLGQTSQMVAVDYILDLDNNSSWIPLAKSTSTGGNTIGYAMYDTVSTEYVLSDAGLYLVQIVDEAGNSTMQVYFVDNTSPVFVVYDSSNSSSYYLASSTQYINSQSTLIWGNYKAIYISGLSSEVFTNTSYSATNTPNFSSYGSGSSGLNVFLNRSGEYDSTIYSLLYSTLFSPTDESYSKLRYLDVSNANITVQSDVSSKISSYSSMYITIEINSVSYYTSSTNSSNGAYASQTGIYSVTFDATAEETYSVLIRDASNTKLDLAISSSTALRQYTAYYSAKQTIIVSFDDSAFKILYPYGNTEENSTQLVSYITQTSTTTDAELKSQNVLTSYFSPLNLETALYLSFIPTVTDTEVTTTVQVDTVTVSFYEYEIESYKAEDGTMYYYTQLSTTAQEYTYYSFSTNGASSDTQTISLNLNSSGITTAGKYVITRTYKTTAGYTVSEKDYYSRTFVIYVDRYGVVTSSETAPDDTTHSESMVGGDIFVSMFDSGTNADLVVSFPNSDSGNTDGQTIYNNGNTENIKTILTTNKLPVNIYIPQYKYTSYVTKNVDEGSYSYSVNYADGFLENNNYYYGTSGSENSLAITDYVLFAQLYKDGTKASNLIAATSSNPSNPTLSTVQVDDGGFLVWYYSDGSGVMSALKTAGEYYVKIYQGYYGNGDFEQTLTFKFEIKSASPDFDAKQTNGASLSADENVSVKNQTTGNDVTTIYYTNQSEVTLTWDATSETDNYMVEIDIEKISITTKSGTTYSYGTEAYEALWTTEPTRQSNNTYLAVLNLESMSGVYQTGGWVEITMQFENHNINYYSTVTKRIYVDLSAPTATINALVEKTTSNGLISALTESALRTHLTAKNQSATSDDETSYNISNSNGTFAYYSYSVSASFLSTLKSNQENITYVKAYADGQKYASGATETTPSQFAVSNGYSLLDEFNTTTNPLVAGTYYEVVETDKASNMTIFTIYVADTTSTDTNLLLFDNGTQTRSYTVADYNEANSNSGSIYGIYLRATDGYSLSSINYFGDAWAILKLETCSANGTTSTQILMLSPHEEGYVLAFSGSTTERIAISSLIDGSTSLQGKHSLSIYNRISGETDTFYISVYNATLSSSLTSSQSQEYIQFSAPTSSEINSTTKTSVFLTSLTITATEAGSTESTTLYQATNKLGLTSLWVSNSNITVSSNSTLGTLTFTVNDSLNLSANTKVEYVFEDNFGTAYKEIHLYNEPVISQEISSSGSLYAYTDSTSGTLYYITDESLSFTYNPSKYKVSLRSSAGEQITTGESSSYANSNGTYTLKIEANSASGSNGYNLNLGSTYNTKYQLYITDTDGNYVKSVYFQLYNQLPTPVTSGTTTTAGQFVLLDANGNNITSRIISDNSEEGYFSEVRISYTQNSSASIPVVYSISTDGETWTEVTSGTRLQNTTSELQTYYLKIWYNEYYLANEYGSAAYVFESPSQSQIYTFDLSSLTTTYWIELTESGQTSIISKESGAYTVTDTESAFYGSRFANHYMVNIEYSGTGATGDDSQVQIQLNKEQGLEATQITVFEQSVATTSVKSELILISNADTYQQYGVTKYETYIVISYLAPTSQITDFYVSNVNGVLESDSLTSSTTKTVTVSSDYSSVDRITLQWTKYYGIQENYISISVVKDGITLTPQVYTKSTESGDYYYTYLTYSGKYTISFSDRFGNTQKFGSGSSGQSETFTLIFLKDVPFTVSYTDIESGEEVTTLPITQAVFNSSVTLSIDSTTRSQFYQLGGYPIISVKRNGSEYDGGFSDGTTEFSFTETGYYEVTFSATAASGEELRQETYAFTILNANEYKISYILNKYSNYYVQSVQRDGKDITDELISILDTDTVSANGTTYLTTLSLNYLDEKTGSGVYTITVNSNNSLYQDSIDTCWTYQVTINQGSAPLKISVDEGESTTSTIKINYNSANMFAELGDCTLRVVKLNDNGYFSIYGDEIEINSESTGSYTFSISDEGTYFVQVLSSSGTLLFSYKVIKNEPMNAATIIIIVVSVVVAIVVVVLIIKLRKRISVK